MKNQYVLLTNKKFQNKRNKITKIIKLCKNKKITIPFIIISILFFSIFIIFIRKSALTQKTNRNLNYSNNIIESTILLSKDNITLNLSNTSSIISSYEENITLNNTTELINSINITLNNDTIITLNNNTNITLNNNTNITLNNNTNITLNNDTNITLNNNTNIQNSSNTNPNANNSKNFVGKLFWRNKPTTDLFKIKEEIKSYSNYQISFKNASDFKKRKNPKVTVITAVHNQQNDVKKIYASIQRQELKDIEIIFVDDNSTDNTSYIIKSFMEKDKRIVYLKNEKNRRAFYSRNRGILNATGEYILIIDPDDLLLNNILIKAYETAKKYDLDMVQFYALLGFFQTPRLWRDLKHKDGILKNNQEIRNNFYNCMSRNLWDKLIRREVYVKSVNFMKDEFKDELYVLNNDDTAFFGLLHVVETYGFLEDIGYFYILRPRGAVYYRNDPKNTNAIFRSIFNNMRYFYIQSDDTIDDKINLAYKYFDKSYKDLKKNFVYLSEDFDFIIVVLDLYINSNYFNESQKNKLKEIKSKIMTQKKRVKGI